MNRIGIKKSRQLIIRDSEGCYCLISDFKKFIENNKTLKTFRLIIPFLYSSYWFKYILKLDQLIQLDLSDANKILLNNHLIENIRQLAINCKQIKKFYICVEIDSNDSIDLIPELFSTFNGFKRLKRFGLKLSKDLRENQQMIQQML